MGLFSAFSRTPFLVASFISWLLVLTVVRNMRTFVTLQERSLSTTVAAPVHKAAPPRGIAITVAWNHQPDPMHGTNIAATNPYLYIKPWYESIMEHENMHGVVIGNMFDNKTLSDAFKNRNQSERISFEFMDPHSHVAFQNISDYKMNDQRFFVWHWWLQQHRHEYDYAILTDVRDVWFHQDPFVFMNAFDKHISGNATIYAGEEHPPTQNAFRWLSRRYKACMGKELSKSSKRMKGKFFNAGILGGRADAVMLFLERMIEVWQQQVVCVSCLCDMVVFNIALHEKYDDDVVSGWPFHTKFKGWEGKEKHAFIQHK